MGDSVTQIFRRNKETNKFESIFRTVDHDAGNLEEQRRILINFPNTKFKHANLEGVGAIYARHESNEIMVVGSFGDFKFPEGFLRRTPDINVIELEENDVIICSTDGYYETYNPTIKILCPGRDENEISNDLNLLYENNKLYGSSTLAYDLMELHINHIIDIYTRINSRYPRDFLYRNIMENRDNNNITTFIV